MVLVSRDPSDRPLQSESSAIPASTDSTPFTDDFKEYLDGLLDHYHVPSVSISVIDGDETHIKVR